MWQYNISLIQMSFVLNFRLMSLTLLENPSPSGSISKTNWVQVGTFSFFIKNIRKYWLLNENTQNNSRKLFQHHSALWTFKMFFQGLNFNKKCKSQYLVHYILIVKTFYLWLERKMVQLEVHNDVASYHWILSVSWGTLVQW